MEKVALRPSRDSDLPFVLRTEIDPGNSPYISRWSEDRHRQVMADPDWAHEVIEDRDAKPVGYLIAQGMQLRPEASTYSGSRWRSAMAATVGQR